MTEIDPVSGWPVWLGRLGIHQDFFWFFSLIGWSLALVVWWRHPRRDAGWAWLPWSAGAAIATAVFQFCMFDPPFDFLFERLVPGTSSTYAPALINPDWLGDVLIGAAFAGMVSGWIVVARCFSPCRESTETSERGLTERDSANQHRSTLRWLALPALAGVAALHAAQPLAGGAALAVLSLLAGAGLWRRSEEGPVARTALVVAAALPALSTIGPVAAALHTLQREGPPSPWGLLVAVFQCSAAALALVGLLRDLRQTAAIGASPHEAFWREARPFIAAAALWLAGGLSYAIQTGWDNRWEVVTNRLRTAASRATVLDPALVESVVGPELRLDRIFSRPREAAGPFAEWRPPVPGAIIGQQTPRPPDPRRVRPLGFSEHLAAGVAAPLEKELARIVGSTPHLEVARIVVPRDGWLLAVASNHPAGPAGTVELLRRATPRDEAEWARREPWVELSPVPEMNQLYFCRAPVVTADGRMLAWLEFVRVEFYSTSQRKWRAGPLLVTALGVVLAAVLFMQRRHHREREAALRAAAIAAESSRVKTAFLAKVSHELRTPLQSILGYSELLQRELTTDAGRLRLAALRQHGELMIRLVNDLLDLSAMESGAFRLVEKPVALAELVRQAVESLRPRATVKSLTLKHHIDPQLPPWVAADAERMRQIVLNLVGNALKFTERGRIDVALTLMEREGQTCTIELMVADTGPGIAPADQPRLFQPFSRLDPAAPHEGAGLGLALVAALCQSAGGAVRVESDGVSGSCFRATLCLKTTTAPAAVAGTAPVVPLGGRRILLADDNTLVRELFSSYLGELGATCVAAADGEEALAAAQAEPFDAVVLDLAMPRVEGLEVARRLRARGSTVRIVGVSAHANPADRDRAFTAGMDAFLSKPVELSALAAALAAQNSAAPLANDPHARLQSRLLHYFRREAPARIAAAEQALGRRDGRVLATNAHWLSNSATALRDDRLFAASAAVEAAADAGDFPGAEQAWAECTAAVGRWLRIEELDAQ